MSDPQPPANQNPLNPPAPPTPPAQSNLPAANQQIQIDPAKLQKFNIPPVVKEKYSDLVNLIMVTESMNDDERQYWFQILPIMTPEQVEKFKNILVTEKEQLAKLDQEYDTELKKLNEKHLTEWQEFEIKEKKRKIKEEESKTAQEEQQKQEDLLNKLDNS